MATAIGITVIGAGAVVTGVGDVGIGAGATGAGIAAIIDELAPAEIWTGPRCGPRFAIRHA